MRKKQSIILTLLLILNSVGIGVPSALATQQNEVTHYITELGRDGVAIINPTLEVSDPDQPDMPLGWQNSSWGDHQARFFYLNEGHTGNRSIKVEITAYRDGDAKWFFEPVLLNPGVDYIFRNYYRSNVDTRVILAITRDDESIFYQDLPVAPASSDWMNYEAVFTMPLNAKKLTVFHLLDRVGYLITDNYSIETYTSVGFARGLVSLTFDDGWEENTETALPLLQRFNFKSTQYYATTFIENSRVDNPLGIIQRFLDADHELGSHSVTHPDLRDLSPAELEKELLDSKRFLEDSFGVEISHFAAPYGAYNLAVRERIMHHYASHRTVEAGFNSRDRFDLSRLKVQNILNTTGAAEVSYWVQKAKRDGTWLILVYHRIGDNPGLYDTTLEQFAEQLQVISDTGLPVMTVSEALTELLPQLSEEDEIDDDIVWDPWEPQVNLPPDKTWTIQFNRTLDISTIKERNIYVTDKHGQIVPMFYYQKYQDIDKKIYIVPVKNYIRGEIYTLWIRDLKATDGSVLSKNVKMVFSISSN